MTLQEVKELLSARGDRTLFAFRDIADPGTPWPSWLAINYNFGTPCFNDVRGFSTTQELSAEDLAADDWLGQTSDVHYTAIELANGNPGAP